MHSTEFIFLDNNKFLNLTNNTVEAFSSIVFYDDYLFLKGGKLAEKYYFDNADLTCLDCFNKSLEEELKNYNIDEEIIDKIKKDPILYKGFRDFWERERIGSKHFEIVQTLKSHIEDKDKDINSNKDILSSMQKQYRDLCQSEAEYKKVVEKLDKHCQNIKWWNVKSMKKKIERILKKTT